MSDNDEQINESLDDVEIMNDEEESVANDEGKYFILYIVVFFKFNIY
jgi:hypothetical protein